MIKYLLFIYNILIYKTVRVLLIHQRKVKTTKNISTINIYFNNNFIIKIKIKYPVSKSQLVNFKTYFNIKNLNLKKYFAIKTSTIKKIV